MMSWWVTFEHVSYLLSISRNSRQPPGWLQMAAVCCLPAFGLRYGRAIAGRKGDRQLIGTTATMQTNGFAILISLCISLILSDAFSPCSGAPSTRASVRRKKSNLSLFRELVGDDEEDLRAAISTIVKQDGLEKFLQSDKRLCVIKLYAPFCKACKAFGVKFRRLALERGDRINAAGEVVHTGMARFGEIEYSSNIKLCKYLNVKKFPTVLIYRGGRDDDQRIGEIDCRNISIEKLLSEMDQVMETVKQ
jgi:thiol-disulfide isomerase/thioredoxin